MRIPSRSQTSTNGGIYGRISGELGFGGGAGFDGSELISSSGDYITLDKIEGNDTEHHAELGPLGYSWGGNVRQRRNNYQAFTKKGFGDDYITRGVSFEPVEKNWKTKPKLSLGYRVSMGRTKFLYTNRKR